MRLLTKSEIDIVAGGWGESSITVSHPPYDDWPPYYDPGYDSPGGSAGGSGGSGGNDGGDPGDKERGFDLKDVDCPMEKAGFTSAIDTLRTASPTAAALIDRVLNGSFAWQISLVNDGKDGTQVGLTNINWDPFSGLEFADANGNVVHQSPMVALAHELAHAEYWDKADSVQYEHALTIERQVAAELNAYFSNNNEAGRAANSHAVGTAYATSASTTTNAATGGRPSCG